ncbi:hypothetical protein BC936DRAFT_140408 [Jimgerdemannia flammicorona]|uniref:ATPase of the ABC class C-terminal domain-containing protein n=1 Tax=Jimgerdemannia flammicorona TaxID=994334 RepID=A0A433AUC3_9FUNG|nr:hypothetical protein BC936DRAFT_140408 [Jimgerdemannia flammicorona]
MLISSRQFRLFAARRSVTCTDITPFINNLPICKDTQRFSTEDASGSTSMAANIQEALEVRFATPIQSLLISEMDFFLLCAIVHLEPVLYLRVGRRHWLPLRRRHMCHEFPYPGQTHAAAHHQAI